MVKFEIKHKESGEVLFTAEINSLKRCVELAVEENADLSYADLSGANLRNANLSYANLTFSSWPLWCGSLDVKLDKKQKRQLLYHVLSVAPEYRTSELLKEANKFHRIPEVPKLESEVNDE